MASATLLAAFSSWSRFLMPIIPAARFDARYRTLVRILLAHSERGPRATPDVLERSPKCGSRR